MKHSNWRDALEMEAGVSPVVMLLVLALDGLESNSQHGNLVSHGSFKSTTA